MDVFSNEDLEYALSLGISKDKLIEQWKRFNTGFPNVLLDRPALIDDGIIRLRPEEKQHYKDFFEREKENFLFSKFTPASGAASRMFLPIRNLKKDNQSKEAKEILENLSDFPFYEDIVEKAKKDDLKMDTLLRDPNNFANFLLEEKGLDFDRLPKGLVTFYRSSGKAYSAFELQVEEAKEISNGNIHFTVSDDYLKKISDHLNDNNIQYSIQSPSTHYIASADNDVLRDNEGRIIFRPSGHGALLKNLSEMDADIVFIKNIDNIQASTKNDVSIEVKKVLGGFLIELKEEIDTFLQQLKLDPNADVEGIKEWIKSKLDFHFNLDSKEEIFSYLNRPIRIAGMVLNEGKAGGGPFWVKNQFGTSLQIVEGAQINKKDPNQLSIIEESSHFNPVELVCSLTDFEGNKFDLFNYVDEDSGFLSQKQIDGKEVTIMERPGLWNGSMANWLSVFIEIPLASFTPVKSIFDLLTKEKSNS